MGAEAGVPTPPRIVRLQEIEAIPGPGSLTWRPVRLTLGIEAFGTNAYTARDAGQEVVEPHTEDPEMAHQELYFVAAGRATFTIDGESHDAPAGTYVFVPDPGSHRQAVAAEPNTTVLSFGGPPTFTPSAWEWAFQAAPLLRTDPERARQILTEGLRVHPDSGSLHYNVACLEALEGKRADAIDSLRRAIEKWPPSAEWARDDDDFSSLREDPQFRDIVGTS
jgi:mannose-6-phosphate isomerase-like protein (cupin superfamily)